MIEIAKYRDQIVFDGTCVLCSRFAQFMAKRDTDKRFAFVTAQSALGRRLYRAHGLDPEAMETNIVIVDGVAYTRLSAFEAAMRVIGWPWKLLTVVSLLPTAASDWIYNRIANNRYRFGRRACPLPSKELKSRLIE